MSTTDLLSNDALALIIAIATSRSGAVSASAHDPNWVAVAPTAVRRDYALFDLLDRDLITHPHNGRTLRVKLTIAGKSLAIRLRDSLAPFAEAAAAEAAAA